MPNWCNNTIYISHDDAAMMKKFQKAWNEGHVMSNFIPIPQELKDTVAGFCGKDTPEQLELEKKEASNLAKYGYKNWYDYAVREWGTKWDFGNDDQSSGEIDDDQLSGEVIVTFCSAWSPPIGGYEKLAELGFYIKALYFEPGMNFCGIWDDRSDEFYDIEGNSEWVMQNIPDLIDLEFGISESMAEWEEENQEEEEENA
jgi:hypothetical protein